MNVPKVQAAVSADEQLFFDTLEARGEVSVRADLDLVANRWDMRTRDVQKWLKLKDVAHASEETDLSSRIAKATEDAAKAAERSALAAEEAAMQARRSANQARVAWITALIGIVVAIAIAVIGK